MKMDEYMESELSGIFQLKLEDKNIGTHFMFTKVNWS